MKSTNTVPQAPPLPSSLLLAAGQQGAKLAYLDKKFKENTASSVSEIRTRSTFKKASIASNSAKRLSCEELEDLKDKFQVYLDLSSSANSSSSSSNIYQSSPLQQQQQASPPLPPPPPLESLSQDSNSVSKPEPPARTVSIRNSMKPDDTMSIKSNGSSLIYGVGHNHHLRHVRNSRSVFSIYEEEAAAEEETCSSSGLSSHSSSSTSSPNSSCCPNLAGSNKLERLAEYEIKKLEAMYRSMGAVVCVGPCTCDLFTTTSEQVASMLSNCWRLEMSSFVPIWIFDTGYNLKRTKKLTLMFVDRQTAFPLLNKPLLVTQMDQFRCPNNDKRLTFTLSQNLVKSADGNSGVSDQKLIGLIQFYDFLACHEFFKFYREIVENMRNFDMFEKAVKASSKTGKNFSSSMLTLNGPRAVPAVSIANVSETQAKKFNRYSEYIPYSINYDENLTSVPVVEAPPPPPQQPKNIKLKTVRTITKSCISSPCAFQHVNSLKSNNDQHIKLLIENFSVSEKKLLASKENLPVRLRKK